MNKRWKILIGLLTSLVVFFGIVLESNAQEDKKGFEDYYNIEVIKKVNEEKGLVELENFVYLYEEDKLIGVKYGLEDEGNFKNEEVFGVKEGKPSKEDMNQDYVELRSKLKSAGKLEVQSTFYTVGIMLAVVFIISVFCGMVTIL